MITIIHKLAGNERGASAVEFALISPILILLMLACMNIGQYFLIVNSTSNAIDEAARYATIDPTPSSSQIRARFDAANFTSAPASQITFTAVTATATTRTNSITITASRPVTINLIFFNMGSFTVRAQRVVYVPK